jgi:hypothetical protein
MTTGYNTLRAITSRRDFGDGIFATPSRNGNCLVAVWHVSGWDADNKCPFDETREITLAMVNPVSGIMMIGHDIARVPDRLVKRLREYLPPALNLWKGKKGDWLIGAKSWFPLAAFTAKAAGTEILPNGARAK